MAPRCPFPTEECTQIVGWWYELDKDLDKVRWKYAKLKGLERHPMKLPKKNVFKSIINRFLKTGTHKQPLTRVDQGEVRDSRDLR